MDGLSPPLARVAERLFTDFASELPLPAISAVLRRCRRELDVVPDPALPELLERLARQRLHDLSVTARGS